MFRDARVKYKELVEKCRNVDREKYEWKEMEEKLFQVTAGTGGNMEGTNEKGEKW